MRQHESMNINKVPNPVTMSVFRYLAFRFSRSSIDKFSGA